MMPIFLALLALHGVQTIFLSVHGDYAPLSSKSNLSFTYRESFDYINDQYPNQ